jgi:hypothetical protein
MGDGCAKIPDELLPRTIRKQQGIAVSGSIALTLALQINRNDRDQNRNAERRRARTKHILDHHETHRLSRCQARTG